MKSRKNQTQQNTNSDGSKPTSRYVRKPNVKERIRLPCHCVNCHNGKNLENDKKEHVCHYEGCNKVYGKTSHLRTHLVWHSGQRPYSCDFLNCMKSFVRLDDLQRHHRIHTGEKRFECPECSKRFTRSDHLAKHIRIHNKDDNIKETLSISSDSDCEERVPLLEEELHLLRPKIEIRS